MAGITWHGTPAYALVESRRAGRIDHFPPSILREGERIAVSAQRKRLLCGEWGVDLEDAIICAVNSTRARVWGTGSTTRNVFKSVCTQVASAYDDQVEPLHEQPIAQKEMHYLLSEAFWTQRMGAHFLDVGLREGASVIRMVVENGVVRPEYLMLEPTEFIARGTPLQPSKPVYFAYFTKWTHPVTKQPCWLRHEYDIGSEIPKFRIIIDGPYERDDDDVTRMFVGPEYEYPEGGFTGENYPFTWSDGRPFIPAVVYHALPTPRMYDYNFGKELVDMTLEVGVLTTMALHNMKNASFKQKYIIDGHIVGAGRDAHRDNTPTFQLDAAYVANIKSVSGDKASVGEWGEAYDPVKLQTAIQDHARDAAMEYGISPSDVHRTHGNAQSGYAVQLTQRGLRNQQRRYRAGAKAGDLEVMRKTARMRNLHPAPSIPLPEDGWGIRYHVDTLTPEEQTAAIENSLKLEERGLQSPVKLYMRIHGIEDEAQARSELTQIRIDRSQFGVTGQGGMNGQ